MVEEVTMGGDQWEDQEVECEEGAVVVGSAENDEFEAKTQENPHPHPTSRQEKKNEEAHEMSQRYAIRYEKWSDNTLQAWKTGRRVQVRSEVHGMMRAVTSQRSKADYERRKKSVAAKATKWTWRKWRLRMRRSCG